MTAPASVDWTPQYLAVLPPKWETDAGTCWVCSAWYAIELRGILTGQPVVSLSQLFGNYLLHQGSKAIGGTGSFALAQAKSLGVCAESAWPITLAYGKDTWASGISDYDQTQLAMSTKPSAAAYADAPNHKVVDYGPLTGSTIAERMQAMREAIAAGFPVTFVLPSQKHELCAMGYNADGPTGLDPRSGGRATFSYRWEEIVPSNVVRSVRFNGVPAAVFVPPSWAILAGTRPSPSPAQPTPQPTGNAVIVPQYQAAVAGLKVGQITPEQLAAIDALRAQITPDALNPVPVPAPAPPPGASADGTSVPPSASLTDGVNVWSLDPVNSGIGGKNVLQNGRWGGVYRAVLLKIKGGVVYQQNSAGDWWLLNGTTWTKTIAP